MTMFLYYLIFVKADDDFSVFSSLHAAFPAATAYS